MVSRELLGGIMTKVRLYVTEQTDIHNVVKWLIRVREVEESDHRYVNILCVLDEPPTQNILEAIRLAFLSGIHFCGKIAASCVDCQIAKDRSQL